MSEIKVEAGFGQIVTMAKSLNIYFEIKHLKETSVENIEGLLNAFKGVFGVEYERIPEVAMLKAKETILQYPKHALKLMLEDMEVLTPLVPREVVYDFEDMHNRFNVIASSESLMEKYTPEVVFDSVRRETEMFIENARDSCHYRNWTDVSNASHVINQFAATATFHLNQAEQCYVSNSDRDGFIKNLLAAMLAITVIDSIMVSRNTYNVAYRQYMDEHAALKEKFGDEDSDPTPGLDMVGSTMASSANPHNNELNPVYYTPEDTIDTQFERMELIIEGAEAMLLNGGLDASKHKEFLKYCCMMDVDGNEGFVQVIKDMATKAYEGIKSFFSALVDFITGAKKDAGKNLDASTTSINESISKIQSAKGELEVTEKETAGLANQLEKADKDEIANQIRKASNKSELVGALALIVKESNNVKSQINAMESEANSASNSSNEIMTLAGKAKDDMESDARSVFKEEVKNKIEAIKAKGRELSTTTRKTLAMVKVFSSAAQLAKRISEKAS